MWQYQKGRGVVAGVGARTAFAFCSWWWKTRLFILDLSGLPAVQSCPPPEMWRVMKHIVWQLRLRRAPSPPVMYHSRTKLKSAFKAATLPSHCACEGWQYGKHFRISIQQRGITYVVNIRLLSKEQNKEETKCSCCKCFFGRCTRKFKWFVIWLKNVRLICSGRWLINLIDQTRKEMEAGHRICIYGFRMQFLLWPPEGVCGGKGRHVTQFLPSPLDGVGADKKRLRAVWSGHHLTFWLVSITFHIKVESLAIRRGLNHTLITHSNNNMRLNLHLFF